MKNKIQSIILTDEFKKEILFNSLCNGLGQICSYYDLQWDVSETFYDEAKKELKEQKPNEAICIEDVLMKVLENGKSVKIVDLENEETHYLRLKDSLFKMDKLPIWVINQFLDESDDLDSADVVLQICIFGEVIFG
jgi:hypothetical protein